MRWPGAAGGDGPLRSPAPAPPLKSGLVREPRLPPRRPLIKLQIIWKKDGVPVSGGISDYSRRLTIPNPTASDAGYYQCEAVLRSSSVPPAARGAYLSVLGEAGAARLSWAAGQRGLGLREGDRGGPGSDPLWSSRRAASVCQGAGETRHSGDGEGGGHPLSGQRYRGGGGQGPQACSPSPCLATISKSHRLLGPHHGTECQSGCEQPRKQTGQITVISGWKSTRVIIT